jgi:hypothetical protein
VSLDDVLRRPLHHLSARVGDELLVLDPGAGALHVLSASAAAVYQAIDGTTTTATIASALAESIPVQPDRLLADVISAVESMIEGRLVIADDPSSDAAGLPRLRVDLAPGRAPGNVAPPAGSARTFEPVRAGAATVQVRTTIDEVAALVAEPLALLPPARASDGIASVVSVTEPGDGGPFEIHLDDVTIASAPTPAEAADAVLSACNRVATTEPPDAVRIHGGVVALGDRAVVICGESGTGKSTLTAALVQRGWRYLTDEVAVIDPSTFAVTPYPKWIDLSPGSLDLLGLPEHVGIGPPGAKHHVPPDRLGSAADDRPARVTTIVMLTGDGPGADEAPLGARDAVTLMLANVFATTWDDRQGLRSLVDLCSGTTVVHLPRSGLADMADRIAGLL